MEKKFTISQIARAAVYTPFTEEAQQFVEMERQLAAARKEQLQVARDVLTEVSLSGGISDETVERVHSAQEEVVWCRKHLLSTRATLREALTKSQ